MNVPSIEWIEWNMGMGAILKNVVPWVEETFAMNIDNWGMMSVIGMDQFVQILDTGRKEGPKRGVKTGLKIN